MTTPGHWLIAANVCILAATLAGCWYLARVQSGWARPPAQMSGPFGSRIPQFVTAACVFLLMEFAVLCLRACCEL